VDLMTCYDGGVVKSTLLKSRGASGPENECNDIITREEIRRPIVFIFVVRQRSDDAGFASPQDTGAKRGSMSVLNTIFRGIVVPK
jgi:hypothetical protein